MFINLADWNPPLIDMSFHWGAFIFAKQTKMFIFENRFVFIIPDFLIITICCEEMLISKEIGFPPSRSRNLDPNLSNILQYDRRHGKHK